MAGGIEAYKELEDRKIWFNESEEYIANAKEILDKIKEG